MKIFKQAISLILLASMILLMGCTGSPASKPTGSTDSPAGTASTPVKPLKTTNLMAGVTASGSVSADPSALIKNGPQAADFAIRLMQAANEDGKNTLVSPLSVMSALAMTLNGAEGETLAEMERVLGMSRDELNGYFSSCMKALAEGGDAQLSLANSIWFTADDHLSVNRDFLQCNADHFGADIYKAPFDDTTLKDINDWVSENTHGMIPAILDRISPDEIMYLINALAFEAEWQSVYSEDKVRPGEFTTESGEVKDSDFMYSEEKEYLSCPNATGFMKPYKGGKYAFAALLPNEGVTVAELLSSLDGQTLYDMLSAPSAERVYTSMPKFETAYDTEMSNVLKAMGMPKAFDSEAADFSGLGTSTEGNIYISRVIHKTFISVGEKGTRAGAATAVAMAYGSAFIEQPKTVFLDRPFIYMLVDLETNTPFFIGTMMEPGK